MHIYSYAYLSITCYIIQGERGHPGLPGPFGPKGEGLPGPTVCFTKIYFCSFQGFVFTWRSFVCRNNH